MLKPEFLGQFKRDYKQAVKRGCDPKKLRLSLQCCAPNSHFQLSIEIMR